MAHRKKLIFIFFLLLLISDRLLTLLNFGFVYTDFDQVLQWGAAFDYAEGAFHEPFFYGQNYNFMLESILAVPLLWLNVPVQFALPLVSSFLAIFPFVVLGIFLFKRSHYFWAYFCIVFPILLPLEANFLTSISRGFLQASLFIPLLYPALFDPENRKKVAVFFVGSGLSFIANPGALILIFPLGIYLFSFNYRSFWFYLSSFLMIPSFLLLFLAKRFYLLNPDRFYFKLKGIDLKISTFLKTVVNTDVFEYLFPFFASAGFLYLPIFIGLLLFLWRTKKQKELIFVAGSIAIILLTWSIPKVQDLYENGGVFFSSSRLYLHVPILFFVCLFFVFRKFDFNRKAILLLTGVAFLQFGFKNFKIKESTENLIQKSVFAIEKVNDLAIRVQHLDSIAKKHKVEIMIVDPLIGWAYAFESYAYVPISHSLKGEKPEMISVFNSGDKRVWLYDQKKVFSTVLLYVMPVDDESLKPFDYDYVGFGLILIRNNELPTEELMKKLNLAYRIPQE